MRHDLTRKLTAEAIGTGFLLIAVIGSGIMAERLSPADTGLQLLENAAATAGALVGLILMFGAVSGAHFNPAVTLSFFALGEISRARRQPTSAPRLLVAASGPCSPTSCLSCPS
ncbi:MAG: aquaporin [Acidimicrobiales bacterium]